MSDPPPPPVISPDGKYYWDGNRWVPRYPPPPVLGGQQSPTAKARNTASVAIIALVVGVVLVTGLIWYFGFYDTAESKCNRGDIGACLVVAGKQAAAQASADAAAAERQAQASAAAAQQQADLVNRLQVDMLSGCTVVWDPNHNMRLTYIGANSAANCASAIKQGWQAASRVDGSGIVCADESSLVVEDTGGWALGTDLCNQLGLQIWSQ